VEFFTYDERMEIVKNMSKQIALGASLLGLSAFFYYVHYRIFHDPHHIFLYLIGDIAFVFIEVLLVTLIIHRALEERDRKARMEKLNMVIGAFYSEVGTNLLEKLSRLDSGIDKAQDVLGSDEGSPEQKIGFLARFLGNHHYTIDTGNLDWQELRDLLANKRDFMLRLLENPNLLEHEYFTDLLWAAFHLTEELSARETLESLPQEDYKHLGGDINRVYTHLARQWIEYMSYLRISYPYLFSLALRRNPFNRSASPVVHEPA